MKMKKILSLIMVLMLILLCACAQKPSTVDTPTLPDVDDEIPEVVSTARYTEDGRRIITIGTWQDLYYMSKHQEIYEDDTVPQPDGTEVTTRRIHVAELRLEKIREIEEKYNVVLESVNLTFQGVQESINTSVPEGHPDVEVYQVDTQFGIPAVLRDRALALEDILPANSDVLTEQNVMKSLKLSGQDKTYLFNATKGGGSTAYPLAFNLDMILDAGLENPQDLYERGEWTWDVWLMYLNALTKDTNGDGRIDVYGYGGYWTNMLSNIMMSNGTGIARGPEQTLDSPEMHEVLEFIGKIYNVDKVARPWDAANWEINNSLYADELNAFWIGADWIFSEQGGVDLPFEVGVVPWPCGPSGDPETNSSSNPDATWFMIPAGVEDPELIYNIMYDWVNWYGDEVELGDDRDWSREQYMTQRNFDYAMDMSQTQGFDLWESLSQQLGFSLVEFIDGTVTVDAIIETYAQQFQMALDGYFDN